MSTIEPLPEPSTGRLLATVAALAADEFGGRRAGTAGGRAAAAWLADRLRAAGATVRTHEFPVSGIRELSRTPYLEWTDGVARHELVHRRDFVEHPASSESPIPYPGRLAMPDAEDRHGAWVVSEVLDGDLVGRALEAGAVGVLVPRGTDTDGWMPKVIAGPPAGPVPVIAVRTDIHQAMVRAARAGRGEATGSMPLTTVAATGTNVHGVFTEPSPGQVSVLLTAHYDGVGDDPTVRLPAAGDNASGVAVVLEAAGILAPILPDGVGLAVAFLDAEEAGAHGSAHHAPTVAPGTQVINVDGAARLDGPAAVEAGGPAHALLAALDRAGRDTGVPLRTGAMPSDNRQYAAAGLAAIGLGMGIPGYQTPAETVDSVEPSTLDAATRLVVATVAHLLSHHETSRGRNTMSIRTDRLPVAVIGAGPVGLAAAAHLADRAIPFVVLEAGPAVAASIADWGHVRLFSPWRYNTDAVARRLLEEAGWHPPDPDHLPTGSDLIADYLALLAAHPAIAPSIRLGARVEAVSRTGYDRVRTAGREQAPFQLRVRFADGTTDEIEARAVIDASGTWTTPNTLGANGLPAHGETDATASIVDALPDVLGADRDRFAGRHTVVVGAGHSATTTLLALAELAEQEPATTVTWAIRAATATRAFGGGEADALPARGAIGTRIRQLVDAGRVRLVTGFFTHTLTAIPGGGMQLLSRDPGGAEQKLDADTVVNATGFRPDHSITDELRLDLDPVLGSTRTLAPLIDPNVHSCGTVPPHGVDELTHPEPGFYAVGVKSYGRAPTFLLATGYEQARSVVAALAGDWTAARDVRLDLPETGVCSTNTVAGHGLATGVEGGLLTVPLVEVSTGGCCG